MIRKLLVFASALSICGAVYAASIAEDIVDQGTFSWWTQNTTAATLVSGRRDYEDVTAVNTIAYSECGKTFFLNSATEFASTLPAPEAGCWFKFIVKAAPSGAAYTILTNASANILIGGINELEVDTSDDGPYDADADTITFADGVAAVGDYVEMVSDGTSWYITGQANADGGVVPSKAS